MGKLIIFEGLDGSGKGTQTELACQNLHSKGYDPLKISFPDYDSPSSALLTALPATKPGGAMSTARMG